MSKYHVGDHVIIKEWDDMVEEYGLYPWGDIDCHLTFARDMRKYCGKEVVITDVERECEYEVNDDCSWVFSNDMIECLAGENIPVEADMESLEDVWGFIE